MHFKTLAFKHFFSAAIIILILSSPFLFYQKEFLNLWFNDLHNAYLDSFFKYVTYIGGGWLLVPVFILLLSKNYFLSLLFVLSALFESILVQLVLKKGLFADMARPINYILDSDLLNRVEGVQVYSMHSFPSGHTQTAFLIITFLVLLANRKSTAYFLLLIAVFVALSRVYLLQHFFIDVWFGALIGLVFPWAIAQLFYRFSSISTLSKWNRGFFKN